MEIYFKNNNTQFNNTEQFTPWNHDIHTVLTINIVYSRLFPPCDKILAMLLVYSFFHFLKSEFVSTLFFAVAYDIIA